MEGEATTTEKNSLNPSNLFQQDDILHHLFAVLPVQDLLTYRLVCKQWNIASLPYINAMCLIHINYPQKLAEFLDMLENTNYKFGQRFFLSSVYMDHPVTNLFFSIYGTHMKSLKLCIRDEHQMSVQNLEHLLLHQAPFLESLEISLPGGIENQPSLFSCSSSSGLFTPPGPVENGEGDGGGGSAINLKPALLPHLKRIRLCNNHGYHPGFLTDLFAAAVNLENLKALLDNSPADGDSNISVILSTLETTGLFKKLKKLELESIVTEKHFSMLSRLSRNGMQLKSLVFTQLHPRYFDKNSLQDFLLCQRNSLEYLTVDSVPSQYYWEDEVNLTLAQMKALKVLTVAGQDVPLPAAQIVLYDLLPQAMSRFDNLDKKLRKMQKKL